MTGPAGLLECWLTVQQKFISIRIYFSVTGLAGLLVCWLTIQQEFISICIYNCDRPGWFISMLADGTIGIYQYMYIFQSDWPGWFVGMLADGTIGIYEYMYFSVTGPAGLLTCWLTVR